jgi:acyl-CoA synthetase (NDP forming)
MTERESKAWLARSGVLDPPGPMATTPEECAAAAAKLGRPVALKIQSPNIPHKSDAGGVALGVPPEAAEDAFADMLERVRMRAPDARIDGVLVEPMAASGGFEMILGITADPVFGPMLLVGAGGIFAEIVDDTVLSPLLDDRGAALRLLDRLKCAPILRGARGQPPRDREALADMMTALCRFAAENAGIVAEVDLNPVLVHERGGGATALDALIVRRSPRA